MKYAVVILDGAADEPLDELDGMTALEAARTPGLDRLASQGYVGTAKNVPEGLEASSNIACTSILGYDPCAYPIGRGAIEGAALGIDLAPGEVAFRLNICTVADGLMKSYSVDNIGSDAALPLKMAIKDALDDDTFTLHMGAGFRGILVVKGHPELLDGDYPAAHNISDQPIAEHQPQGAGTDIIVEYTARAHDVLADCPENARRVSAGELPATDVMVFWPGEKPGSMRPFTTMHGKGGGMVTGVDLLNGLAELTGMHRYDIPGVTDAPDNDYAAQGRGALDALDVDDVVFVHIEAPDAEGHDGHPKGKVAAIEAIDREIVVPLLARADDGELRIMALPDHPTPCATKRHGRGDVPFVIWGPGIPHNGAARLTEAEANGTGAHVDPGFGLLARLLGEVNCGG